MWRVGKQKGSLIFLGGLLRDFAPLLKSFARKHGINVAAGYSLSAIYDFMEEQNDPGQNLLRIIFAGDPGHNVLVDNVTSAYGCRLGLNYRRYVRIDGICAPQKQILDFEGFSVAVIDSQTIYILLYGLGKTDTRERKETAVKILSLILDDYLLFRTDPAKFDVLMEQRAEGVKKRFGEMMKEVGSYVSRVEWLYGVENLMEERFGSLTLSVVELNETSPLPPLAQIDKMYEDLIRFAVDPTAVEIYGDSIRIPIGQVDIDWEGKTYDIGELTICIDTEDHSIRVSNETRSVNRLVHPNADREGHLLMGEALCGLAILLGRLELVSIMMMVVQFLHSYDPVTCKEPITSWPIKEGGCEN